MFTELPVPSQSTGIVLTLNYRILLYVISFWYSKYYELFLDLSDVPTTPACTWWNRPEEDHSSGKLEPTHPPRTDVKSIKFFYGVESVVVVVCPFQPSLSLIQVLRV